MNSVAEMPGLILAGMTASTVFGIVLVMALQKILPDDENSEE